MRRKFTLKQLGDMQVIAEEYRTSARQVRQIHGADLRALDSADAKKKYKPEHIVTRKAEVTSEALRHLRRLGSEVVAMVQPALQERGLHSRAHYLTEAGFHDEQPELAHFDKEKQLMLQMLADVSASIKQLTYVTRFARLPDDALVTTCEQAVQSGDVGLVGLVAEEAACRKDSLLKLKVQGLVDAVPVPDADTATAALDLFQDVLEEFVDVERAIAEPGNLLATVGVRNREINESRAIREAEEQAETERVKREAQETAEKTKQAELTAYMAKAKDLPVEKQPAPVIELTVPPVRAA